MGKSIAFTGLYCMGVLGMSLGCSGAPGDGSEHTSDQAQDLTACPTPGSDDNQQRAAASLALTLSHDEAVYAGVNWYTLAEMSVLAPHRYRVKSSGTGIEFDPNDPMYPTAVNATMIAHLAIGQLDSTVAKFLSDGLKYAYSKTDGTMFPRMRMATALRDYKYPGPLTLNVYDSTSANASHYVTVKGMPWCGTEMVLLSDTVQQSYQYSPLDAQPITAPIGGGSGAWYSSPPAVFKGKSKTPWTPFNGAVAAGNPYLVVTVNGSNINWSTYNFGDTNCNTMPNATCSGSIQIDPIPYTQPGTFYDVNGSSVGPQANPFALIITNLYADSSHAGQWATRTVSGVQQWGTFSAPVNVFGTTVYQYVKQM